MFADNTMKFTEPRKFQIRNEIILLLNVDSEEGLVMRRTLEAVGFPVLVADNGAQAADLFRSFNGAIRLMIIDVTVPEEGGLEIVATLRKGNPTLKVIVASAEASPKELQAIQIAGVIEIIRKPVDKVQLLQVVRRIVKK